MVTVEAMDVEKMTHEAMASINIDTVERAMTEAQESMRRSLAEMEEFKRK